MNLNDQRLSAYNKILKGTGADTAPNTPPKSAQPVQPGPAGVARAPGSGVAVAAQPRSTKGSGIPLPGLVKVPGAPSGADGKDSQYRKVAKFLLIIGVEEAARVMAKLTPEQTEKVVLELASIRRVDPDEASIVLAEFESLLLKAREPTGGIETARTILATAFGPERADEMLRKTVPESRGKPFEYLEGTDPERLYRLIADELPATKALVLSQLAPKLAADSINIMPAAEKKETVLRLAKLTAINPDVLRRVDDAMREKVLAQDTASADRIDGRSALAAILKRMDGASEKAILSGLSDSDPELGRDLRNRLFTIDDIVHADDRFMQETLRPMAERDLAVLVAGKSDEFRAKIFANISRARGAIVLEEEKLAAPVMRAESEKITSAFFSLVRRGWENGAFKLDGRDDKEVWI
jgi:flagellar motor switch protein FliG